MQSPHVHNGPGIPRPGRHEEPPPLESLPSAPTIDPRALVDQSAWIAPDAVVKPFAVVGKNCRVGAGTVIGPHCVVHDGVVIGERNLLDSLVVIHTNTFIGDDNSFRPFSVIGGEAEHLTRPVQEGRLIIGSGCKFGEGIRIQRGTSGDATVIEDEVRTGSGVHIAHDCHVGRKAYFTTGVLLAGHVVVGEAAFISGAVKVHQFVRIGAYSWTAADLRLTLDLPPFMRCFGRGSSVRPVLAGFNRQGAEKAHMTEDDRAELRELAHRLFESKELGNSLRGRIEVLRDTVSGKCARELLDFVSAETKWGIAPSLALLKASSKPSARRLPDSTF